MDRLHQQALPEAGAGVGLIVPKVCTIGLGIAAVDNAQRDIAAIGDMRGTAAANRFSEDAVQGRDSCRCGGNGATG
ncbi:hypothetical protein D3C84_585800 [compost metagenome]